MNVCFIIFGLPTEITGVKIFSRLSESDGVLDVSTSLVSMAISNFLSSLEALGGLQKF